MWRWPGHDLLEQLHENLGVGFFHLLGCLVGQGPLVGGFVLDGCGNQSSLELKEGGNHQSGRRGPRTGPPCHFRYRSFNCFGPSCGPSC